MELRRARVIIGLATLFTICGFLPIGVNKSGAEPRNALEKRIPNFSKNINPIQNSMTDTALTTRGTSVSIRPVAGVQKNGVQISLPKGVKDSLGQYHRTGRLRSATKDDLSSVLKDKRVKANPSYSAILLLSRLAVIDGLSPFTPEKVEGLYAEDFYYLLNLYKNSFGSNLSGIDATDYEPSEFVDSNDEAFPFTLPHGFYDGNGKLQKEGAMRRATALDEVVYLSDPNYQSDPSLLANAILARVITRLGSLDTVDTSLLSGLFSADLAYLQEFYNRINGSGTTVFHVSCPHTEQTFEVEPESQGEY